MGIMIAQRRSLGNGEKEEERKKIKKYRTKVRKKNW